MKLKGKYLVAVALLVALAVVFGLAGTVTPGDVVSQQQLSSSSSGSMAHFTNPPTFDSGWVDIKDKCGEHVALYHGLNTTDVTVDVKGKHILTPKCGATAWSRVYGGVGHDYAYWGLVQTSDDGYALAGCSSSFGAGSDDFWLVKTDESGNHQWNRTYGGVEDDVAYSTVQTSDGGYAIAGYTNSFGVGTPDYSNAWLVKTDRAGVTEWNRTFGGANVETAYSLVQTDDGGYAMAGLTASFGAGSWDFYLVKTDSDGNMQWNQTYGGVGMDYARSLVRTGDGGYALAGYTSSFGAGSSDFWLVKTDSAGTALWNRTYGGTGSDYANSVAPSYDGGYALVGSTASYGAGGYDIWLIKADSEGNMLWNRTHGGTGSDFANSVAPSYDGGYTIVGRTNTFGAGSYDFWLIKTNSSGNHLWNRTYGGAGYDSAFSLVQTGDRGYALSGYTNSLGIGDSNFWLIKLSGEMSLDHQKNLGGTTVIQGWSQEFTATYNVMAQSVIQTCDGGYAIAGYTYQTDHDASDIWLAKTDWTGRMLWNKTYGRKELFMLPYDEKAYCVIQTADEGYALAGYASVWDETYSDWFQRFLLVKTDSAGNYQWNRTYGGYAETSNDVAYSLTQTVYPSGGYMLAGYTSTGGNRDFYMVGAFSNGGFWGESAFGGSEDDVAYSVVQTRDGGYALGGITESYGAGKTDYWLIKTDNLLSKLWDREYGGAEHDFALSMVHTSDGGYALAGETNSSNTGDFTMWLVKADANGTLQWNQTYGYAGPVYSLIQTTDEGYAIAGTRSSKALLVKTDAQGEMQWSRTYKSGISVAESLTQTVDGGYAITGYSWQPTQYYSWLLKSDVEKGLAVAELTNCNIILYRSRTDPYWNYVRVRIWTIQEPTWIYGDLDMDGDVDAHDLLILSQNYGWPLSLLSLGGIIGILGLQTYKARKKPK